MANQIRRRAFISLIGGAAAWALAARAQQPAMPIVGFVNGESPVASWSNAFRKGLNETGYVECPNVTVEYHWLEGQIRSPAVAYGPTFVRRAENARFLHSRPATASLFE